MKSPQDELGHGGVERTSSGVALARGKYFCIVPQEAVTISAIEPLQGFTASNYQNETLAAGIPFYLLFRTCTLTGKADVYKVSDKALSNRFDAGK